MKKLVSSDWPDISMHRKAPSVKLTQNKQTGKKTATQFMSFRNSLEYQMTKFIKLSYKKLLGIFLNENMFLDTKY